jgi:hypothetical protein
LSARLNRFGVGGELGSEGGDQQVLPGREAAEQGGDANAGPAGDLFGGSLQPLLSENLPGGLQQQLPVAFGVSAQVLPTAVAGVVRLHACLRAIGAIVSDVQPELYVMSKPGRGSGSVPQVLYTVPDGSPAGN